MGFPGQLSDQEGEVFYNLNRFYYPRVGRYFSSDPKLYRGSNDAYGYAYSNPIGFVDNLGLLGWAPAVGVSSSGNTIACDGKGGVTPVIGDPYTGPCSGPLNACLFVHENMHALEAIKRSPGACRGQVKGTQLEYSDATTQDEIVEDERSAYSWEKSCLERFEAASSWCGSACSERINKRRRCVESYVDSGPPGIFTWNEAAGGFVARPVCKEEPI